MGKKIKRDRIEVIGEVVESFRSARFLVKLNANSAETVVSCTLCGKMKENYIKIVPGDTVVVELCPYDMTSGRIISRGKQRMAAE